MNEQYSEYLLSDSWQHKRLQRLAISNHRCAACMENKAVHVHHLTYEHIFNEPMEDLLPLCKSHHEAAEDLVRRNKLSRIGNVLFLATETIRLISSSPSAKTPLKKKVKGVLARNPMQEELMQNNEFLRDAQNMNRGQFKHNLHHAFNGTRGRSRFFANALALYDRLQRQRSRTQ